MEDLSAADAQNSMLKINTIMDEVRLFIILDMVCPLCGKSLTQFTKVAEEKKWPKLKRG